MTPRSFWKILLKISGIWIFVQSLPVFFQTISSVVIDARGNAEDLIYLAIFSLLAIALIFGACYLLIFQSDLIINKLKLIDDFEDEVFTINMHRSGILTIAVVVLGGWMFVDSLPNICQQLYTIFGRRPVYNFNNISPDYSWLIFYTVKAFAGILMIVYCRDIVNLIEYKRSRSSLFIQPGEVENDDANPADEKK